MLTTLSTVIYVSPPCGLHYSKGRTMTRLLLMLVPLLVTTGSIMGAELLSMTLTPPIVEPGGYMVANCSFSTVFTADSYAALIIADQNSKTVVVFEAGGNTTITDEYKLYTSDIVHPEVGKWWGSVRIMLKPCYKLKRFTCHLYGTSPEHTAAQTFKIHRLTSPDIYYNNTCITCALPQHGASVIIRLNPNDTATLECHLERITDVVRLAWSPGYSLIAGTNQMYEDTSMCVYNYTSQAIPSKSPLPAYLSVYCTAITFTTNYTSTFITIQTVPDKRSATFGRISYKKGVLIGAVVGTLVGVILIIGISIVVYRICTTDTQYKQANALKETDLQSRK